MAETKTNIPCNSRNEKVEMASGVVGAVRSSDEGSNDAGAKGPHLRNGGRLAMDEVMTSPWMVKTPNKVQKLQSILYRKAKSDPRWRAWSLYGDLCRQDVLEEALEAVVSNNGAAGEDGMRAEWVKENKEQVLLTLIQELKTKEYKPGPVKRVWIAKADGKLRPLGVPNVRDRIVQKAILILIEPIFEADFDEASFAYRKEKNAQQAVELIRTHLRAGMTEVIDADLSGYFDTIEHAALLKLVAKRVSDGEILRLVKLFLKAPIVEIKAGKRKYDKNDKGTPQGGVLSPLLANLFLNSLDHGVNDNPELGAKLVRFADDFVILCKPRRRAGVLERLKKYLLKKKLVLNEKKTRLIDFNMQELNFLSFKMTWRRTRGSSRKYVHTEPSVESQNELRETLRGLMNHWTEYVSCTEMVRRVNQVTRGWAQYFYHWHCSKVFGYQQYWIEKRLRSWLWHKYNRKAGFLEFFNRDRLIGQYNLWPLPAKSPWSR